MSPKRSWHRLRFQYIGTLDSIFALKKLDGQMGMYGHFNFAENNWISCLIQSKQSKDSICLFAQPACLVLQGKNKKIRKQQTNKTVKLTWLNYKFVLLNRPRLLKRSTWCWWCMPCQKRQDGMCRTKHSGASPSQLRPLCTVPATIAINTSASTTNTRAVFYVCILIFLLLKYCRVLCINHSRNFTKKK